jgi:hypothetical protein
MVIHINGTKAALTDGTRILAGVDGRTYWAKRMRALVAQHLSDLGGADNCSFAEQAIIRRASCLGVELERLEQGFCKEGGATPEELDLYSRASSGQRRLLEAVGLDRRSVDVTPDIDGYLERQIDADS